MLVPNFLCSETIGGSSSHSQPQKDKSFPSRSEVLDGNFVFNSSSVIEPSLGSFDSFKGCIFSCSDTQVFQTSSWFSVSGSSVPVCSASIRSQGLPMGVYESGSDGRAVSSQTRGSMFYYLDDWLTVPDSRSLLLVHLSLVLQKVQDLGFLIN